MAMATTTSPPQVQHVTKASSDQLLSKFAEMDSESPPTPPKSSRKRELQIVKKSKRSRLDRNDENCESPLKSSGGVAERRSLLPRSRKRCAVLREIGVHGMSKIRARDLRNKSLLATIEKAWRKTIEGASKMFMENHYNRHKRLINDVV